MVKILFGFMTLTGQGAVLHAVKERPLFQTEQECVAYGETMTPKVENWIRGRLGADWDHPVVVTFQCLPNGIDA